MPEPAFIVEGHLEQRMVQAACPGKKVVLLGTNGDGVSMRTISTRIETHVKLFSNRYYPIVVVFDREKRIETVQEMSDELCKIFVEKEIDPDQFIFFISDRDIECLFVCHISPEGEYVEMGCPNTTNVDGVSGEGELRSRLAQKNITYHKTTTGLELFKRVRPIIVAKKSPNFRAFQSKIIMMCKWACL